MQLTEAGHNNAVVIDVKRCIQSKRMASELVCQDNQKKGYFQGGNCAT